MPHLVSKSFLNALRNELEEAADFTRVPGVQGSREGSSEEKRNTMGRSGSSGALSIGEESGDVGAADLNTMGEETRKTDDRFALLD